MVLHATAFSPCIYDDFSFPFFFILPLLSFCFVLVVSFFWEGGSDCAFKRKGAANKARVPRSSSRDLRDFEMKDIRGLKVN